MFKKLLRPGAFIPLLIFVLLLLFVGVFALTREGDADISHIPPDDPILAFLDDGEFWEQEDLPVWIPPAPPRWFRSNAGGMALEEIPSRLAALRNRYALVIDFIGPDELEPFLRPFFSDDFDIQIRVLFEGGEESRRQWLFVDDAGNTRLNAVFRRPADGMEGGFYDFAFLGEDTFFEEDVFFAEEIPEENYLLEEIFPDDTATAYNYNYTEDFSRVLAVADTGAMAEAQQPPVTGSAPVGFIEVFNENGRIVRDYLFAEDGSEMLTAFFYNEGLLIRAETKRRDPDDQPWEFRNIHTDHFRYNRSFSLRYVRRVFYEPAYAEPVRITFPYRLLDAAFQDHFITRVTPGTEFMETLFDAGDGFNVRYETDIRGRVLTQTMLDENDEVVWEIRNTWDGDRIVAILRTEDGEERLTEFEFDSEGNRIVQREIRDGFLERIVRTDGARETEELYMDGTLMLRAVWEDGRRISEERVRR